MPENVKFQLHIAQQLALADPTGIPDGCDVLYPTTDGRTLRLPYYSAVELNALDLAPGEVFCMRKETTREHLISFRAWRPTEADTRAAERPAPPAGPRLVEPRQPARRPRENTDQPRLFDFDERGTGTYGPAPRPRIAPARPQRPEPIPFNIAFGQVAKFVTDELNAAGEEWNDKAKQATVCTVLIAAAKAGYVGPWER